MEVGKTSTALKTDIEECHHLWDHHFCDWVAASGVFFPAIRVSALSETGEMTTLW